MLTDLLAMLASGLVLGLSVGYAWGSRHAARQWWDGHDIGVRQGRLQAQREMLQDMVRVRGGHRVEIRPLGRN